MCLKDNYGEILCDNECGIVLDKTKKNYLELYFS